LLRRAAARYVRRSGHVAALQRVSNRGAPREARELLSAARVGLREVPARAARTVRAARAHLHRRVCLFLLVLGQLARAFARLRRGDDPALWLGAEAPRGGNRFKRRLPAAVLRAARP